MLQREVLVKWTGSKRIQASTIVSLFPPHIKTYYEPFVGGGSVLYALLSSNIKVDKYECSDLNTTLIQVWELVKHSPQQLFEYYTQQWPCNKEKYYLIRQEFNQDQDPKKFFFLLRTCRNGLVRYNLRGQFNAAFHEGRMGITPDHLWPILETWHCKLQRVHFAVNDYQNVQSQPGDFLYLDPPYPSEDCIYFGTMDFESLWTWMRTQQGGYALSMSGLTVPPDLYCQQYDVPSGFQRINRLNRVDMRHGLYLRRPNNEIP